LARDGNYECRRIGGQAVVSNLFSCYCRFWWRLKTIVKVVETRTVHHFSFFNFLSS
jgi:hypothetical protein